MRLINSNINANKTSNHGILKTTAITLLLALMLGCTLGLPSSAQAADSSIDNSNILIIYYSRTGNTGEMAGLIKTRLNCDMIELQTVDPYPEEYRATTEQAKRELERGYRPPLQNKITNLDEYDVILIGSPCWWGTVAMPIFTFLNEYDLSGKTIYIFMTHGGSGLGRSVEDVKRLCPEATVKDGLAIRNGRVKDSVDTIYTWLDKQGLGQK